MKRALMVALSLALLVGCSDGGPSPSTESADPGPEPHIPSIYMDGAANRWNYLRSIDKTPWRPKIEAGRRWRGDPATYEKVCGATFLDEDGNVPPFYSDAPAGGTWYDSLRADPLRWAAFNAWIADPAVKAAITDNVESQAAGGDVGGHPWIGDYSGCQNSDQAGEPVKT